MQGLQKSEVRKENVSSIRVVSYTQVLLNRHCKNSFLIMKVALFVLFSFMLQHKQLLKNYQCNQFYLGVNCNTSIRYFLPSNNVRLYINFMRKPPTKIPAAVASCVLLFETEKSFLISPLAT
jgi:hypothetical protein